MELIAIILLTYVIGVIVLYLIPPKPTITHSTPTTTQNWTSMKLKAIKCQKCLCYLGPYKEDLEEKRDSCDMGKSCGLIRYNSTLLIKRNNGGLPIYNQKLLPKLLTKAPNLDTTIITISDPIYIHIINARKQRVLTVRK